MNLQLKQVESTLTNLILIFVITFAAAMGTAGLGGGIHGFPEFVNAASHGLIAGALVAFGWLGMKSPLAGQVRTLLGTETVTEPSGKTTETTIAVTEPMANPVPTVKEAMDAAFSKPADKPK